ncbi:tetratricopeptide repeat protein [Rhizobium sp. SG570]|uniref:tetratricopeptide repeat protein n=1 Tax=Rhizobium sp. SG570 TaxID=2587113 RepID=UPI00144588D0|nr:tetratricopeptide repeat protein [Rhizobium sp. SG570]NKJ34926.1 TolA-binding protein [Rhizobium sp. SG570]
MTDPGFERSLSSWVDHAPLNPLPRLIRAQYYLDLAWHRRGHRFTRETDKAAQAAFSAILRKGVDDIQFALVLDPQSAYGLYLRLMILRGYGATEELDKALQDAVAVYPDFMPSYGVALSSLQPKWGGSTNQMYAFVDHYGAGAPDGSPLKLLSLQLYKYLLESADTACTDKHGDAYATCFQTTMKQSVRPGLEANIAGALDQFGQTDAYETNEAVSSLVNAMIEQSGAEAYSGQILQATANSYHSDPRLIEDKGVANNFMIDELVGRSWLHKGFYDNAIAKYKESLNHLEPTRFPSPEQKDLARAAIYETLAQIYSKDHHPAEMAEAANAALALDGKASNRLNLCYGHYQMNQYTEAVRECSKIVSDPDSGLNAYYWRGLSYQEMHDDENAIKDLVEVASSQNGFRASAAISLTMIYFGRKDNQAALGVLNKYAYLYDGKLTSKDDVAVAYNNRCYAYMELGDYQKALDDCNASLANASIPDAFKKKEELVAKLSR